MFKIFPEQVFRGLGKIKLLLKSGNYYFDLWSQLKENDKSCCVRKNLNNLDLATDQDV